MIRSSIEEPWRQVSWEEAFAYAASEIKRIQAKYGRRSVGGISSSRCTNEETFLVQKLVRAGFGNNNIDTCARVCHSPTGYGLKSTFGTSAGTQGFRQRRALRRDARDRAPTPPTVHPVFASRMKRRLREGAKLIVIDPRRIDLVRTPHVAASHHLALTPGTNVAVLTAMAHSDRHRGACQRGVHQRALRLGRVPGLGGVRLAGAQLAGSARAGDAGACRRATRCGPALRHRRQRCDLLRPRRDRAQPGLVHGDGDREPCDGDRQHRPPRRRREPSARPEQRAGRLRHGLVPARAFRLPPHLRRRRAAKVRGGLGRRARS